MSAQPAGPCQVLAFIAPVRGVGRDGGILALKVLFWRPLLPDTPARRTALGVDTEFPADDSGPHVQCLYPGPAPGPWHALPARRALFSLIRHGAAVVISQVRVPADTTEMTQVAALLDGIDLAGVLVAPPLNASRP